MRVDGPAPAKNENVDTPTPPNRETEPNRSNGRPLVAGAAIKLAMVGALLHGLAVFGAAVPEAATRPLLHGAGWLAWGGAAALARSPARPRFATPAGSGARAILATLTVVGVGLLLRRAAGSAQDVALVAALGGWPVWLSGLAFVIAPAVGEEAFFRGAGLQVLRERAGPVAAALASALAFAVCHPSHPVAAGLFGAALAALALATGRVREAILAHAAHNAIALWLIWPSAGAPIP